jgi:hypothetical protein
VTRSICTSCLDKQNASWYGKREKANAKKAD